MSNIQHLLQSTIDQDGELDIVYKGGSSPGTIRRIRPLKIMDDKKLAAFCLTSQAKKTFMLAKITLPDKDHSGEGWEEKTYDERLTLDLFYEVLMQNDISNNLKIELIGFENSDDLEISVYRFWKNGKPRKTPEVVFAYEELRYDRNKDKMVERNRKWIVESKHLNPKKSSAHRKSFQYIEQGIELFMPLLVEIKELG